MAYYRQDPDTPNFITTCPICGKNYLNDDCEYYICPDCEQDYIDFDAMMSVQKKINPCNVDFQLECLYECFFETKEEMESALDYYIKNVMPKEKVNSICTRLCRDDPIWHFEYVAPEIDKRRGRK